MASKKRIFISPLDWGLGHATRCIPIIKELNKQGAEVIIGADRNTFDLLKAEFPKTLFIKFPGYDINYAKNSNMLWQMAKMSPKIIGRISIENKYLNEIIRTHNIKGVISDNRYGLYNKHIPSVFITHQLFIKTPIGKGIIKQINKFFINKYDECWIPDFKDKTISLSGELAHKKNFSNNIHFINPLSRFKHQNEKTKLVYDVMAIILGPEPQRTIFEEKILSQLQETNLKALIILGNPSRKQSLQNGNIKIVNHLNAIEMEKAIQQSNIIISRSGYTTIMDLATIGKKAIFIPTPGQPEQKYLAKYHTKKGNCIWDKQKQFNLTELISNTDNIKGFSTIKNINNITTHVERFLNKI